MSSGALKNQTKQKSGRATVLPAPEEPESRISTRNDRGSKHAVTR